MVISFFIEGGKYLGDRHKWPAVPRVGDEVAISGGLPRVVVRVRWRDFLGHEPIGADPGEAVVYLSPQPASPFNDPPPPRKPVDVDTDGCQLSPVRG